MRKIIHSEFPEKVNWKKFKELIDFDVVVIVAVKNLKEYNKWKRVIENKYIKTGAWPILSREEGYWFSGHCSKKSIDKLDEFKNLDLVKIDLEFPIFQGRYSNIKALLHIFKLMLRKPKNYSYLKNKISSFKNIIVNEFPFPNFIKKRLGIYYPSKKNIMFYTTFAGLFLRWLAIIYYKIYQKFYKPESISIGLIGKGIFGNEPVYKNVNQFKKDLKIFKSEEVCFYSVESILKRKNPKEWIKVIKEY